MNDLWNTLLQWLHRVGLHPDRTAVEQAGGAVLDSASAAAAGVGQAVGSMDMASLLALAAALGWASGFRLYLVVFLVGLLGATGALVLPGSLQVLAHPALLFASGGLLCVEFFADKIPGVDSLWDLLQSVLRVPAGAALAAGVFGADHATMALAAALMGGTLAATSQAAKTTTRAVINTSPEPFSNLGASLAEDTAAVGAVWLALAHPAVFAAVLAVTVVLMWVVTWLLWRFLKTALRKLRGWMGATEPAPAQLPKT
ncbi:DUF4126 domain-containing protein [Comamonas aquatica]|uniref:DUF4126 domain-containing protein n=1 Tax=Comamonas aquatica TaxID=225991 RepID=A0AA42W364_9BURK|nr:DUF4126 domain-containing protein [Comamonas aquatica]MDH1427142.1 DUF4126 domain-containing protein [Comamonas aquatica]MDH1605608.1 DUF4126 domain-containing protein [Comamonas aquatica]MDH1617689.1 DUF4126 domain-containing protein [Comamonas aquatica]MDH2005658.1 DUF4126 domain-containing protein [Comamonas aquatica]